MAYRILFRRDTAANWATNNPVLSAGEPGFTTDTNIFKIGDGVTAWSSLQEINPAGLTGPTGPTGPVNFNNIASDIIASADATYDLGTQTYQWNNLYVAGSMYLGDSAVTLSGSGTNFILAGGTGNQVTGNLEVSGDLTVNGTTNIRPYKVYTALLTQSGGDNILLTASDDQQPFIIGVTYEIAANSGNADFTNIGAPNNNVGTRFIATGTTPASWGDGGYAECDYNTGAPVVTVLENTIGNVWFTYGADGLYSVESNSLFIQNKSSIVLGNVTWDGGSGILKSGFDGESYGLIVTALTNGDPVSNNSLINTMLEIRVYN